MSDYILKTCACTDWFRRTIHGANITYVSFKLYIDFKILKTYG